MKRDCDPLTLPTTMLSNVVVDDTVVGGGPLSMISSAACAAIGTSMATALDDDSRRRRNRCVTCDDCFEPAKPRWRMARPSPSSRGRSACRNPGRPALAPIVVAPVGSDMRRYLEAQLLRKLSSLDNRRL